ncbi:MAG TPA: hypothetical protein VJ890_14380 [Vineibacter sp.]|nr:hypothetical protein [Vineibacter sp.]
MRTADHTDRERRLARALRDNLRRRKDQARAKAGNELAPADTAKPTAMEGPDAPTAGSKRGG